MATSRREDLERPFYWLGLEPELVLVLVLEQVLEQVW
jgi:hypothetical protein